MSAGRSEPSLSRVEVPRRRLHAPFRAPRRATLIVVGAVVSGVCLWLAVRQIDASDFWRSLQDAEWIWLAPTIALTYATLALRAVRWRELFVDPDEVPLWESVKAVNVGLLFNNILPSRAGEVPRIFALAGRTGISKVEIGSTVVIERILDVFTIAVAGLIVWPWLPQARWVDALGAICAAIVGLSVVLGVAAWVLRSRGRTLAEAVLRRVPLISDERAEAVSLSLARGAHVLANPRRLLVGLGLSAFVWTAAALSVLTLFPAFDLPWSLSTAWFVVVATSLALTVPSTSGGLGVYEAAAQASLVAVGTSASGALAFALVLHAVNFVPVSITGALAAWGSVAGAGRGRHAPSAVPRTR